MEAGHHETEHRIVRVLHRQSPHPKGRILGGLGNPDQLLEALHEFVDGAGLVRGSGEWVARRSHAGTQEIEGIDAGRLQQIQGNLFADQKREEESATKHLESLEKVKSATRQNES